MKAPTLNRHLNAGRKRALAEHEEPLAAALERVFVKAGDAAARRFEASAVDHLTAAAPASSSCMIAVYPSPEEAVALAQPNGELAEILHVTLAYLGEVDPDQAEAAVAVVQQVAMEYGPLEGIVGGIAAFAATDSSDGLSPSIVLPDVPGLAELRQGVCDALEAAGIDYATNHGWQPHLTLVYTEEPQPPPVYTLGLPLTFDRLTVARGDVPRDFPLGALTAAGGPADWSAPHPDEVVDVAALVSQIRARNDEVRRAAVAAAMTPALVKAGLDFDVTNPLVGAVLARSGQHVTDVAETTRLNVMRTIRESYEQGLSIPDTAAAIRAGMAAAAPARARLIARTELARVVNGGAIATVRLVGEAAGVTYEKSWLVAEGAEYPRHEEYDGLDGQTVGLDEQFDVGGYAADYPGDESLPPDEGLGCRCTTIAVEAGSGAESEGPDGVVAALSSADEPILGGHVKRSTVRTRQRRAAHTQARRETNGAVAREELAQLADRAVAPVSENASEDEGVLESPVEGETPPAAETSSLSEESEALVAASEPSDFVHVEFDTISDSSGMTAEDFENVGRFVLDIAADEVFERDLHTRTERGELTAEAAMELRRDRFVEGMAEDVLALAAKEGRELERDRVLAAVRTRRGMSAEEKKALAADPSLLAGAAAPVSALATESELRRRAAEDPEGAAARFLGRADALTPPTLAPSDQRVPRAETPAPPEVAPTVNASQVRWEATLVVEGTLTEDGRYIEPNATTWRELPLTLMAMLETSEGGHVGAEVAGRIDEIWRGEANPDGSVPIFGRGVFDDSEFGHEVARMVEERVLRGNSVDLAVRGFELAYPSDFDESGHRLPEGEGESREEVDPLDAIFGEQLVFVFTDCVIGMSTVCPFPAFRDAQISLAASGGFVWTYVRPSNMVLTAAEPPALRASAEVLSDETPEEAQRAMDRFNARARDALADAAPDQITASAAGLVPLFPPGEWFENPELEELTPLTVTDDGRVFGHLAEWDRCHIGIMGACVKPPRSLTNYAYFLLGETETDTGDRVATGAITLGTGHASEHVNRKATLEHYDNTGSAVADVVVGEDQFGPWIAGALRPDVPAERVRVLTGSKPSGDWRGVNGNLELVAILAVNVPGFPVPRPRAAFTASGEGIEVTALVAAGIHDGVPLRETLSDADRARLETLAAQADGTLAALADLAAEAA